MRKKEKKVTYRQSVNFKLLSERQLENIFPGWNDLLDRIDSYRKWLGKKQIKREECINKQYNLMYENVYTILGGRGSGKTSAIFTLREYLEEDSVNNIVLPIVMPEVIPEHGETLGWILASLEELVKKLSDALEVQEKNRDNFFHECKRQKVSLADLYDEVKELCYSRQTKDGGTSFSEEIKINERRNQSGYELSKKMAEFWMQLVEAVKIVKHRKEKDDQKEPLIYLIFDDVDLNPEKALEICSTIIKYLSHPNLIIFMTADEELFYDVILNSMTHKMKGVLKYMDSDDPVNYNLFENSFERVPKVGKYNDKIQETASLYMRKIMPVSSRYPLKTFEDCAQKRMFCLDGEDTSGKADQSLEEFLKEIIDKFIIEVSDNVENKEKNFLYYNDGDDNNFISIYLMFLGTTSRQITDGSLVIQQFLKKLSAMGKTDKKGARTSNSLYKKERLKEYVREFVVDIMQTRGIYWGNNYEIMQMARNLIISREETLDIYISYAYVLQLFDEEIQYANEDKVKARNIISRYLSLFMLLFFIENILLLMTPLLQKMEIYGQRNRIHGHRYLVTLMDKLVVPSGEMESLIKRESKVYSNNLSEFLYTYGNIIENYYRIVPFNRYRVSDVQAYLYGINTLEKEVKAETLEEYYWNSPKWFSTVIPMIWFAYKGVFSIDKDFYNQNVKRLYGIHIYTEEIADFLSDLQLILSKAICEKESEQVETEICEYKNLVDLRNRLCDLYSKVDTYWISNREKFDECINRIKSIMFNYDIERRILQIENSIGHTRYMTGPKVEKNFISRRYVDDLFIYIEKNISNLDFKKENEQFLSHYSNISSENDWRLISYEMTKMKMYLKLIPDSYGQYTKKIIEMQKIYKDTLKQIVKIKLWENSISSSNTQKEASLGQFEDKRLAYHKLYETLQEVYTDKDNEKNSLFIQGLHDVIKNAADGYINFLV